MFEFDCLREFPEKKVKMIIINLYTSFTNSPPVTSNPVEENI